LSSFDNIDIIEYTDQLDKNHPITEKSFKRKGEEYKILMFWLVFQHRSNIELLKIENSIYTFD